MSKYFPAFHSTSITSDSGRTENIMKRFYCTVCKRAKRVQKWPTIVENTQDTMVEFRRGECNWHRNPSLLTRATRTPRYTPTPVASPVASTRSQKMGRKR